MISTFLVKHRHSILGATLLLSLLCAVLMLRVNINSDLTKYLPDDSPMHQGLSLMQEEIGFNANLAGNTVRVMTRNQADEEKVDTRNSFHQLPEVNSVSIQENAPFTLYELSVLQNIDQKALAKKIKQENPKVECVETPQDNSTADASMLIGAVSLLLLVLVAMCASWMEPVLFLASTGLAILLNSGTNALLPSVSVTTHSIAAILQLVLSMDYSIILINRWRQERTSAPDSPTAMMQAIRKAAPSILSSAFTTIVGLLMLVFMKLKIGADLGIVLSKGVMFSLLCNFTVLPSLILLFEKAILKSGKKVLSIPTAPLASFSMKHRIPLTLAFVAILAGSYWLHNQTPVSFSYSQQSQINEHFPQKNPVVLLYDNADEARVATLLDSLSTFPGVEMAISYPSLMMKRYTVEEMAQAIQEMGSMANLADTQQLSIPMDMISEDVLRMVYFAAKGTPIKQLGFNQLASFIISQSRNPHSIIASQMTPDMKQKMAMLNDFKQLDDITPDPDTLASEETSLPEAAPEIKETPLEEAPKAETHLQETTPSKGTAASPFSDTLLIRRQLYPGEMSSFLGMDEKQAKMVYRLAKRNSGTMSPLEFVHFLTDDILKRKSLSSMISAQQKEQLLALRSTMDSAHRMVPQEMRTEVPVAEAKSEATVSPAEAPVPAVALENAVSLSQTLEDPSMEESEEVNPLELLDEMMNGNHRYSPREMARNFSAMGEPVNASLMELLYLYYGGSHGFDPEWRMSLGEMISYLGDSVMNDRRFSLFITTDMKENFSSLREMMDSKMGMMRGRGHSIAAIVTGMETESDSTYLFLDFCKHQCENQLHEPFFLIGESVMLHEMKAGFQREMLTVTLLTILAIFLIVAFSFRSLLIALILVSTVMTGVFVDVAFSGLGGGNILYMAYLIVQSILMGAAIDYGILFVNYYREQRMLHGISQSLKESYKGSIHTILTSGLILILVPGAMAVLVSDATVASIVRAISIGATATILLVLLVLPGLLATCDRFIIPKASRNHSEDNGE